MTKRFAIYLGLFLVLISLSACSRGAYSTTEIDDMYADCHDVDQKIAKLEQQKVKHGNRFTATLESVMPSTVIGHIIEGDYENNAKIASGKWRESIDAKLIELRALRSRCLATPAAFNTTGIR